MAGFFMICALRIGVHCLLQDSEIYTSYFVCHMESDKHRQGFVVYTDANALMTSDGTTTHLIAGNSTQEG